MSQDLISKNQVVSPLTPTRCASGSRMEVADFVSVPENIAASSVVAPMGPSPARSALVSPVKPQLLKLDYWRRMLPLVYEASYAEEVVSMLVDGVRVGRPGATQVIVSPNWPSALEHGAKVAEIISNDLSMGRLHGPFTSPPIEPILYPP